MKKNLLLKGNILVSIVIILCFIIMIYTDSRAYYKLTINQVETVVEMSAIDIKHEIEKTLLEQLTVARGIANSTLLKGWLEDEPANSNNSEYLQKLYTYLSNYQNEYGYTTVFCVSSKSGNYYYHEGFNKTIHENDEHDIWYYNFLDKNQEYDIEVDTDEINDNIPTIFINYRINDENGDLLGVTGVAVKLTDIQNFVSSYENKYDTNIYLINRGGAKTSFDKEMNHFVAEDKAASTLDLSNEFLLNTSGKEEMQWKTDGNSQKCIVNTYTKDLKWNLIVEKNTDTLIGVFLNKLYSNILLIIGILFACICVTTITFYQFNHRMLELENIDELTGLMNRKLFEKRFHNFVGDKKNNNKSIFMLDVDNFKKVNDTEGHLYGNVILALVGECIKECVGEQGFAARWGGDEFIGVLNCNVDEAYKIMEQVMNVLSKESNDVTLSIGIMDISKKTSLTATMKEVDEALYEAKNTGKNKIVIT